jgi:dinuclear metal center YbgI/SA1388 family protein
MARRDEILAFAREYLSLDAYPDHCPLGLQVVGSETVTMIACGVSASRELFEEAAAVGAELLVVHHGLFWDRDPRIVDGVMRGRLEALFRADLNLAAYHLALDAHPEVGNNALLCRALGIEPLERFADVGFGGSVADPCGIVELASRIQQLLDRTPLVLGDGPDTIRRVAVCSGGAARLLPQAAAEGYDCYVTGEPAEPSMMAARESGIHLVAAGHYATETAGVQALAELLAQRFSIDWTFVDLPNPV